MVHSTLFRRQLAGLVLIAATSFSSAAPAVTPGPIIELCSACDPIGGVGLSADQLGFLVIDHDAGDAVTWIVVDRATGNGVSQTVLGNSAGAIINDVTSDLAGGAWIVGYNVDAAGISTPGRWHTSDLGVRETPLSFDGNTDLLLTSVASNGTAFGITLDDFATRILADGTAINMVAGLNDEIPSAVTDSDSSDRYAVGNARGGAVLTLAAWDGDTLAFQDTVAGGNGVIGPRADDALVIVGIRLGSSGPEIAAFTDPFGTPVLTRLAGVTNAVLFGMDDHGYGYAYGGIQGESAFVDTNTMEIVLLSDFGIAGFESLVSMSFLGGNEWLLVLEGSTHYTLATITTDAADEDGDGVTDALDNCRTVANPDQIDADSDLIGNRCDADFDNDCFVNAVDLGFLRASFFGTNPIADLSGDGVVNPIDLGIMRSLFFMPPGPGAPGNLCE